MNRAKREAAGEREPESALQFERVGRHNGVRVWLVVVDGEGLGELWRGIYGWYYEEYDGELRLLPCCSDARMAKKAVAKRLNPSASEAA